MPSPTKPTLLVLAAGMGSRYGGLKQLDPMGPSGQTMLDYAVVDAIRAGFGKITFVIRKDFENEFREQVGNRYADRIAIQYAFQALDDLPAGHTVPEGRTKPWGTAQAVLAARELINEPFAVINADDFYGRDAYQKIAGYLADKPLEELVLGMVGYPLENTLSPNGSVNRGICTVEGGKLQGVEEYTSIQRDVEGTLCGTAMNGEIKALDPTSLVSMNFWGFTPALFTPLQTYFEAFLRERGNELKSECYLPSVIDDLINTQGYACPVLKTEGHWFGVTYPEDKPRVMASIERLTEAGEYEA